jgi:hypothetical protein
MAKAPYEKKSILLPILKEIADNNVSKPKPEVARELALIAIKESKVNPTSKASMIQKLTQAHNNKVIKCIYDLALRYEGLGVIR